MVVSQIAGSKPGSHLEAVVVRPGLRFFWNNRSNGPIVQMLKNLVLPGKPGSNYQVFTKRCERAMPEYCYLTAFEFEGGETFELEGNLR